MKVVSRYTFENNKEIRVEYSTKKELKAAKLPECDALALVFDDGKEATELHMRPDEVVLVIRLLSDALYKTVKQYSWGLMRKKSDRFTSDI